MRVLLINSVCGIRSTGRIVADLAQRCMAQGHEVRIAYGRERAPQPYEAISYRIGTQMDVRVNGLKARLLDSEGLNAKRQTEAFLQWADRYDPDVLWLHNLHGYYIHVEKLFDWIKSRPQMQVRWTLHDCWAFTGHCAHFAYVRCDRYKTQCCACLQKGAYPKALLMDRSAENYRRKKAAFRGVRDMTIVTPSHWLAGLVKQSFLGEYPVEVVHNEIDASVFRPTPGDFRRRMGLENRKIVLGAATAWSERKGLPDYIALSRMLGDGYAVVLVGLTKRQIRKLPPSVIGLERTDSAGQMAQIYTAADVFVNLTYEDTYPTVNLEAQACATPCLTYRTGGSPESVPAQNVVEQGNLAEMAKRIRAICSEG